jgi:hypothetical protein
MRGSELRPASAAGAEAASRLRALGAALAQTRRRLAEGEGVDLAPLHRAVAEALGALGDRPGAPDTDAALLVLLDEAAALGSQIERERDHLKERARAWAHRQRAELSYAAASAARRS